MRVQQDPKLISGEGKARKRDPWRIAMIRLEACQRKQHWKEGREFENKGEKKSKR